MALLVWEIRVKSDMMAGMQRFATQRREKLQWEYKIGLWSSGAHGNVGRKMLIAVAGR
jgi:hypothetical protein